VDDQTCHSQVIHALCSSRLAFISDSVPNVKEEISC
jgi:hypothetical protein